nr:DUF2589 domain-containing protein [uncultured Draconibacterium sp.]
MESNLLSMAQQFSGLPMEALIGGPLNAAANANAAMAVTQTKFLLDTCFIKTHVAQQAAVQGTPGDPTATPPVQEVIGTPEIPEHDEYAPIMIVMSLTRPVLTPGNKATPGDPTATPPVPATPATAPIISNITTQFNLPMLTIIPINSLAVETVDINFEMEVKSSFSEEESQTSEKEFKGESSFEAKAGWGPFSVTVKGSASYDSKDSSTHNTHYQKSNSAKYTVNVHAGQLPVPKGVNTIIEAFTQCIQPITLS